MLGEQKRYYKKEKKVQKAMRFKLDEKTVEAELQNLIKIDKEKNLEVKNIRTDYEQMTQELIQSLLPFQLPSQAEFEQLKKEMKALKEKLVAARKTSTSISSEEDAQNLAQFKQKKAQLEALEQSFQRMQEISKTLLGSLKQSDIEEYIQDYAKEAYFTGNMDAIWTIESILNEWLLTTRKIMLEHFPLELGKEFSNVFANMKDQERFQLLHAQHIVNLKRAEINAIAHPNDKAAQKEALKEQILFQIETSNLQHEISQAIAKGKEYENEIVDSALAPILKEFSTGEKLGAFKFLYPDSVAEELEGILKSKINFLKDREANEMELNHYKEQYAGYDELTKNLKKYGIRERNEGEQYEKMKKFYEEKMEGAIAKQQKYNHEFATIVGEYIVKNSINENKEVLQNIQKVLGPTSNQEIGHIMSQAEKETELGWLQWISTQTFASRCKRAMAGLVTAGGVGGIGGAAFGLGILTPVTGTVGLLGGGMLGGILGFMSPEITEQAKDKLSELQNVAASFIWGKANKISSEYFKDPVEMIGLNPKYEPTERMRNRWGEKGAEIIALAYVNTLFDLHVKLLYASDNKNRDELEQIYAHFYRNYQMLRGDEAEIKKLYKDDKWGLERAEIQVNAAKKINLEAHLKQDLSAMLLIIDKEDKERANKIRNAVNVVSNGIQTLSEGSNQTLLLQFKEAPEIKLLPSSVSRIISPALMMIEGSKENPKEIQKDSNKGKEKKHDKLKEELEDIPELLNTLPDELSKEWEVVKATTPTQLSQELMVIDHTALQHQQLITQMKQCAIVIAKNKKEKQKVKEKFHRIDALAQMAVGDNHMAMHLDTIKPGFIVENTKLHARMNATKAVDCLKAHEYEKFKFWYENIFLVKYRGKDASTCKDAISRTLLNDDGHLEYEGASLWHALAEDSIAGSDLFNFMMRTQSQSGFASFAEYFDFDYVDKNGMNAIVYAASLSNPKNDGLLNAYFNELMASYPNDPTLQKKIDTTLSDIVKLKASKNAYFMPVCFCLVQEMKMLWEKKETEKLQSKGLGLRALSFAASYTPYAKKNFEDEKLFSSILATMAIHCTNGNPVPQSEEELMQFLTRLSKSECVDESMRELILDISLRKRVADESVVYIEQQTLLYQFAQEQNNEKIKSLALEISTSIPVPTREEQMLLKAIISEGTLENIENFSHMLKSNATLISSLIRSNKKFNNKNLLWLAIESGRADIVKAFYPYFHHEFANNAGPDGSAFTFAAKQKNKECVVVICDSVKESRSSGLKRLIPDSNNKIATHYLFESGSWNEIQSYLMTEQRYRSPNYKRALGGPDSEIKTEPKFHLDLQKNTPLHLLLMREDAPDIFAKLNDFAKQNKLVILDLFDIASLNLQNKEGITPFMLIGQNEALSELFMNGIVSKEIMESKYTESAYQNSLTMCLEYAVVNKQWSFIEKFNEALKVVHNKNVPYTSFYSNPVELQVSSMLDNIFKIYLNDTTSKEQSIKILDNIDIWGHLAPGAKIIELLNKIQGDNITAKNYFLTQSLLQIADKRNLLSKGQNQEYLKKFDSSETFEITEPKSIEKTKVSSDKVEVEEKDTKRRRRSFTPSRDAEVKIDNKEITEDKKSEEKKDINQGPQKRGSNLL